MTEERLDQLLNQAVAPAEPPNLWPRAKALLPQTGAFTRFELSLAASVAAAVLALLWLIPRGAASAEPWSAPSSLDANSAPPMTATLPPP